MTHPDGTSNQTPEEEGWEQVMATNGTTHYWSLCWDWLRFVSYTMSLEQEITEENSI